MAKDAVELLKQEGYTAFHLRDGVAEWAVASRYPPHCARLNGAVGHSYISPVTNLNILAPDIATAIYDDALPEDITLFDLAVDPPAL